MRVTIPQLLSELHNNENGGAKIVSILTRTTPPLLRNHRITGELNPYLPDGLIHIAHRSIVIGCNYENLVNNQRQIEGNPFHFTAQDLWHGQGAIRDKFTVYHRRTGRLYFAYKPSTVEPEHIPVPLRSKWFHRDRPLTNQEIADLHNYLPIMRNNLRQGLQRCVFWRTLFLGNLFALKYGNVYDIDHSVPATIENYPL